ncbi:DUF2213 domain-containing protein [Rhizobium rosettiformans]|uniref:DUF2213 domain-containing protein n=1 Tax=Rhizobium rosettiformans TaxID=1368430 RepID=UPI002865DF20|nr:DUF2213 domain-containing protein [Rhizobium rosettiformans]MDR7027253.1 hypothetical protein [Rhizobium rosettiformans]MDR7065374.1 hypothetical protein [Rhizobium rosettiformans]
MYLQDKLTIDEQRRTRDGYLAVNARVARAGNVQIYRGSEVGRPELATVRVFRPADEVFSRDTLQSFAHRPVTLGHPDQAVSATNWRQVAKGWSDGEVVREGEFVRVSMLLADADTISAIEAGTRELSMGYECDLDWTSGVSPAGEVYDAVQRRIRSNHIAVVQHARGGSELRLGDSASHHERNNLTMMNDAEIKTMRDSVRGMSVTQAAALPIFDNVRGLRACGMPAPEYYAMLYGATPASQAPNQEAAQSRSYRDQMIEDMRNAYLEKPGSEAA